MGCSWVFVSGAPGQKVGSGGGVYSTGMVLEDLDVGGNRQGTPEQQGDGVKALALSAKC